MINYNLNSWTFIGSWLSWVKISLASTSTISGRYLNKKLILNISSHASQKNVTRRTNILKNKRNINIWHSLLNSTPLMQAKFSMPTTNLLIKDTGLADFSGLFFSIITNMFYTLRRQSRLSWSGQWLQKQICSVMKIFLDACH